MTGDTIVTAHKPKLLKSGGPRPVITNRIVTARSPTTIKKERQNMAIPQTHAQRARGHTMDKLASTWDRLVRRATSHASAWQHAKQVVSDEQSAMGGSPKSVPKMPDGKDHFGGKVVSGDAFKRIRKWRDASSINMIAPVANTTPSPPPQAATPSPPALPATPAPAYTPKTLDKFPLSVPMRSRKKIGIHGQRISGDRKVFFTGSMRKAMKDGATVTDAISHALQSTQKTVPYKERFGPTNPKNTGTPKVVHLREKTRKFFGGPKNAAPKRLNP